MTIKKERLEGLIHAYERYIAPFTFIGGFVIDAVTLKRIDLYFDNLIIIAYLFLAGFMIVILNVYESGRLRSRFWDHGIVFAPVIMQFAFGGLLSAFVIFYTKSASWGKSLIFLCVLTVLLVGNERFRSRYQRFVFHFSIFFVAVFSYAIFAVPLLLHAIGVAMFLLSGFVSICLIVLFVLILFCVAPVHVLKNMRALSVSTGSIFIAFNLLYFTNSIPPVPLSLKIGEVYHSVERFGTGEYRVAYEKAPWYVFFNETSPEYHWRLGEPVYFFSSVFAPGKLTVAILHRWSYYDDIKRQWIQHESIGFGITGGRDGGFRGYSVKTAIKPGLWRVEVLTETGQVLGRESFRVVRTETAPILSITSK